VQDRQLLVNGLATQALAGAVHLLCVHLAWTAYASLSSLQNKGSTSSSIVAFGRNERWPAPIRASLWTNSRRQNASI